MFERVQILPNTLKHVETCLNSTKQGGQTEKCFANQHCFSMFYRKTFTVWTGLYMKTIRAKQAKVHSTDFVQRDQHGIITLQSSILMWRFRCNSRRSFLNSLMENAHTKRAKLF